MKPIRTEKTCLRCYKILPMSSFALSPAKSPRSTERKYRQRYCVDCADKPLAQPTTKICTQCKVEYPIDAFPKSRKRPNGGWYTRPNCKPCEKIRAAATHAANKDKRHEQHTEWRNATQYGVDTSEYDRMFTEQGGTCAICFKPCTSGRKLAVDHCHDTLVIRGLLCMNCNNGIGRFHDDIAKLESAIKYLKRTAA